MLSDYIKPEILELFADENKTIGERLFYLAKYSSIFFYNTHNRIPSEQEKHEALIFACFWMVKILSLKYRSEPNLGNEIFAQIFPDGSFEIRSQIATGPEFPELYINRYKFYLAETSKMKQEKYDFYPILNTLYINPLPSSLELISTRPNFFEYSELLSVFSIGLKKYEEFISTILEQSN